MAQISIPNIAANSKASSNDINSRFGIVADEMNGKLDSTNLANGAVTTAKIQDGAVTSAKISTSRYVDDNGWTVQDLGTFKIYSRKATATNVTLGEGTRQTIQEVLPPVGRTRDDIVFLTSWHGGYGGHAITGTENSSTASISIILAHNWPTPLTFNGDINVIAIQGM